MYTVRLACEKKFSLENSSKETNNATGYVWFYLQ